MPIVFKELSIFFDITLWVTFEEDNFHLEILKTMLFDNIGTKLR